MVINAIVSVCAIIALAFIEWCLLQKGVDGTIAMLIVASIAGIAGFNVHKILDYLRNRPLKGG